jgi:hypothetical protein
MYDDRDTAITRDPMQGQHQGTGTMHQQMPQQHQQQQPYGYGYGYGYGGAYGRPYGGSYGLGMRRGGWSETKPFFMTSEFLGTLLCVIAIAITGATAADLDARGASLLITILVAAYTVSRGIAKAGTRSRATDPRDELDLGRSPDSGSHDRI